METWKVINPDGKEYAGDRLVKLCLDAQREYIGDKEWLKRLKKGLEPDSDFPIVVCLCGSGRFMAAFEEAEFKETLAGKIVLTIGCNTKDVARTEELRHYKPMLDELHKRKIDIADEVLILNVGGYIGDSTQSELEYAQAIGKNIRFLETDDNAQFRGLKIAPELNRLCL